METDAFLDYLKTVKRYSSHTIVAYAKDLNQFIEFCEKVEQVSEWREVTSGMVRRFEIALMSGKLLDGGRKVMPMSAKTVRRKLSAVRTLFHYLEKEKIVDSDPVEGVVTPKLSKRLPAFVPDDMMDELLDSRINRSDFSGLRDWLILLLAYYTGMRRGELVALKLEDIDFESKVIRVTGKGDKQRLVPMLDELIGEMKFYLEEREMLLNNQQKNTHSFFFVTDTGTPANEKFIYRHVKKCLENVPALIRRSPHVLRHSFATALLNNGAEIEAIRKLLGHASLAATQVYTHNSFENLKKVYNQAHPRA